LIFGSTAQPPDNAVFIFRAIDENFSLSA